MKIPYSTVRGGSRYWELGERRQKASGLHPIDLPAYEALGRDDLKSQQRALDYYNAYRAAITKPERTPEERLGGWPEGSLGAAFHLFRQTEDWTVDKKPKTRAEWEWCWSRYIAPRFGAAQIDEISVSASEKFHRDCRKPPIDADGKPTDGLGLSPHEAWSALKIWRALLKMLEKKHIIDKAPIGALPNPRPAPRAEFWLEEDVHRLLRAAKILQRICRRADTRQRYRIVGLIVRLAWETGLSAVDCRTFAMDMLRQDRDGVWRIEKARSKTNAAAKPPVSTALVEALEAYAKEFGATILPGQPLFRTSEGKAFTHTWLGNIFADVRRAAFGKAERRQLQDIRRSVNLEAELGDADPTARAALLANRLDRSKHLDGVYTPVTTLHAQRAQKARERGRQLLRQELGKRNKV